MMTRNFAQIKWPIAAILLLTFAGCGGGDEQQAASPDETGVEVDMPAYKIVTVDGVKTLQPNEAEKPDPVVEAAQAVTPPRDSSEPETPAPTEVAPPAEPTTSPEPVEEPAVVETEEPEPDVTNTLAELAPTPPPTTPPTQSSGGFLDPFEKGSKPAEPAAEEEPPAKDEPVAKIEPIDPNDPNADITGRSFESFATTPRMREDLGPPLVDKPENLKAPALGQQIWLDMKKGQVVIVGKVCERESPLELFACLAGTKEHESILSCDIEAKIAHACLLALGAKPGSPVRYEPKYQAANGVEIEITLLWKDAEGKVQSSRAQDWVYSVANKAALKYPWVFAGSGFWVDERSGEQIYQAEEGDLICVSNFPTAMLDLPIESGADNNELLFRPFTERIPPKNTPVTILLTPKKPKKKEPAIEKDAKPLTDQPKEEAKAEPINETKGEAAIES